MKVRGKHVGALVITAVYLYRAGTGLVGGVSFSLGRDAEANGESALALQHLEHGALGFDRVGALLSRAEMRVSLYDRATAKSRSNAADAKVLSTAATDYFEAASLCPSSGSPWAGLGQVYLRAEEAADEARPAQEGSRDAGWADVGMPGRVAVGMFRLATERTPQVYSFRDQLVFVFLELGLRDEALETVREAARAQPFFFAHGWSLNQFPEDLLRAFLEEARGALDHAPMLDRGKHLLSLGRMEHRLGDLDRAAADLRLALTLPAPRIDHAEFAYYLARVQMDAGHYREAEVSLDIANTYPSFRMNVIEDKTRIAEKEGRFEEALQWLQEARRLQPANAWFCLEFARIARRIPSLDRAIEALRWAIIQQPSDPKPRIALVETYNEEGDAVEADQTLRDLEQLTGKTADVTRLERLLQASPAGGTVDVPSASP